MEPDIYRVNVLGHLNPHLIWVEVLQTSCEQSDYPIEQIGIFGVLPLERVVDNLGESINAIISRTWTPAATNLLMEIFDNAVELRFKPLFYERNSIFEENIHKFGDITVTWKDGTVQSIVDILKQNNLAIFDKKAFCRKLALGELCTTLENDDKTIMLQKLEQKIIANRKHRKPEVSKIASNKIEGNCELTENNLKLHNLQLEKIEASKTFHYFADDVYEVSMGRGITDKRKFAKSSQKKPEGNAKECYEVSEGTKSAENALCAFRSESTPKSAVLQKMIESVRRREALSCRDSIKEPSSSTIASSGSETLNTHRKETMAKNNTKDILPQATNVSTSKNKILSVSEYDKRIHDIHLECNVQDDQKINDKVTQNMKTTEKCETKLKDMSSIHNSKSTKNNAIPHYNHRTHKCIAFGPPECVTQLSFQIVPKDSNLPDMKKFCKQNVLDIKDKDAQNDITAEKYETKCAGDGNPKLPRFAAIKLDFLKRCGNRSISTDMDTSAQDISSSSKEGNDRLISKGTNADGRTLFNMTDQLYEKTNNINPFQNLDDSVSQFVSRLINPNLMIHSKNHIKIYPALELEDAYFPPGILNSLRNLKITYPLMLQTVSWRVILRGQSLFMISPARSGKTLGYLPAISNVVFRRHCKDHKFGPICIIVCATSKAVVDAANFCKRFVGTSGIVLSYYAGIDEQKFIVKLINGCDILVGTLPALVRLMTLMNFELNLKRLSMLVLDDCERLSEVYENEIKFLISKIQNLTKARIQSYNQVQIILASRIWCDFMDSLAKWAPDTVVCIGSHPECILYCKAPTSIDFLQNENKTDVAVEFIKSVDTTKKTVVVCQTNEEVASIVERLRKDKYFVLEADNTMTVQTLYNLSYNWSEYNGPLMAPILVCCDENLIHLNITDAHNLLHYSMPNLYSTFARRFSVLVDTYPSIFKNVNSNCNFVKILVTQENTREIPKILHFVKRCSKEIPEPLNKFSNRLLFEKDLQKAQKFVPLCDYFMSLGQCPDFWSCRARHEILKPFDEPPQWVPKNGVITFKTMIIDNAVTYSARLLSRIINNDVIKYPQNYSVISMKMAMYYSNENNRRPHGVIKIGDICAVAVKSDLFQRGRVIDILVLNEKGNPEIVLIKLIDEEQLKNIKEAHIFYLPPELQEIPSHIVQIRLGNVEPQDKDLAYSYVADDLVRKMMTSGKNLFMKAEVILAVGTTVIVDRLEICEDLSSANQIVVRYNVKDELLKGHALLNDVHITKLQEMVKEAGLDSGNSDEVLNNAKSIALAKELPKARWAFLEKNDFSVVYFGSAKNLSQIFVRLVKFQDCLDGLTKDIQRYVANTTFDKTVIPRNGELVLAKFPDDGLYYRARVQKVLNKMECECFFVDHGDWRNIYVTDRLTGKCNIRPITEEFITKMPFQAIECRLVGIQPVGKEWTEYSTNWFCDRCFMDNSDTLKELYVKCFTVETPEFTDSHKYGIVVIDTTGPKDIVINQVILDAHLAQPYDEEVIYISEFKFERPPIETVGSDDSDWDKDAHLYRDSHYERKFHNNEKTIKNSLDHLFFKAPIRSVPLIASDGDSMSDGFSVDFDHDDIKSIFNPVYKNTAITELPYLKNDSKKETTLEKYSIENMTSASSKCEERSCDLMTAELENIKKGISLSATITTNVDQNLETAINVGTNQNHPSLISSDFEVINAVDSEEQWDCHELLNTEKTICSEENASKSKLKPKLHWNQTKTTISLKIGIIGVKKYKIDIKDRSVKFLCTVNDIEYAFDIELYGVIKPNMSKHCAKGLYVLVTLYKLIYVNWLSLTRDIKVKRWIVYDPDFVEVSEDEDDCRNLIFNKEQLKKHVKDEHCANSDLESDIDFVDDTFNKFGRDSD